MGNNCELKLRQKDRDWKPGQFFMKGYLLAKHSFPLLWSADEWWTRSSGEGPSVGSSDCLVDIFGTPLHCFLATPIESVLIQVFARLEGRRSSSAQTVI